MRASNSFCADIVSAFKKSLSFISWMDEESAAAAAEKVTLSILVARIFVTALFRPTQSA
jgi:hypothetical protein